MPDTLQGWLCGPRQYVYGDWAFEWPAYASPWPLRADGTPDSHAGPAFWRMIAAFQELTAAQQERYRVGGGCVPLP